MWQWVPDRKWPNLRQSDSVLAEIITMIKITSDMPLLIPFLILPYYNKSRDLLLSEFLKLGTRYMAKRAWGHLQVWGHLQSITGPLPKLLSQSCRITIAFTGTKRPEHVPKTFGKFGKGRIKCPAKNPDCPQPHWTTSPTQASISNISASWSWR